MAFDNSTRRYNITAGLGSSKFDSILRSPEADIPSLKESNSILRNRFTDNLTASARARSSRGQTSVTKKVSYADFASPKLDSGRTDLDQLERQERATTPKKYYFFSEYLKDFNPVSGDAKTAAESGGFESSGYSKNQGARKEYLLNIETREPAPRPSEVGSGGEYSSRKWKGNYTATNHDNYAKKQEIKQRLSQLSEKLYSPLKSNLRTERRGSEVNENNGDRSYGREGMSGRDYSHYDTVGERGDDDLKVSARLDNQNLDVKYRIMVQEYENSIRNLKAHLEKVEKSNADIVRSLREELRVSREDLLREKTESAIKASEDTKALAERVRELEEHLKEQREKNKQQEDLLEENKAFQDKKIAEMAKEIEKIKSERERKVEELNNLLKSQNQSQRDIIAKIRTENESIVKKVRDEQNYSVRDLNSQLEKKNAELERIQKERADALTSLNDKVASLQEITKNNQETYSRLNRTIELKDDEIEKLTRRLNETKKECSIFQNELDGLDYDKGKLEQENERLQTKINRLEKMLYGERKSRTSPHKGKF